MNKCPKCGHSNKVGEKICVTCGHLLIETKEQVSTKALDHAEIEEIHPHWGTSRYREFISLYVLTDKGERKLPFETASITELVLGRTNPDTNEAPDVDLDEYDAQDKGVSRRHAAIIQKDGSLHIVDRDSYNGTFLNGQRLVAHQPRVLRDGDEIRLGYLTIRVSFERG